MNFIIFDTQGLVHYKYDNKINSFNLMINNIVTESNIVESNDLYSTASSGKNFKYITVNKVYFAVSYDSILSFNSNKILRFLHDIAGIFDALVDVANYRETDSDYIKFTEMFKLKFVELQQLQEKIDDEEESDPELSVSLLPGSSKKKASNGFLKSGSSTPINRKKLNAKQMRKWGDDFGGEEDPSLDFSSSKDLEDQEDSGDLNQQALGDTSNYGTKKDNLFLISEMNDILENNSHNSKDVETVEKNSFIGGFFKKYIGGKTIDDSDLDKISSGLINHLITRNVAPEIARVLIEKISKKLKGTKTPSFTSVERIFRDNLIEELTKTLTPNVSTDLLHDIKQKLANPKNDRPYVISMVGVNGVGKSTNLAKLAYWFLQNDFKVLICACDTFRSGAVEQLRVHVKNLAKAVDSSEKIHLFEKGYGGGDHVVQTAKSAIEFARQQKFDIVLIDTAGRTHSNTKLMEPLKKFGEAADPDKIIMVGEALVGTDSVEQARNFNNAFGKTRGLDFFIISKVDTVGPLVGSMINMVNATGVPILFLGVGQTYTDIKRLSIPTIVDLLMS